jgi:signal transduction histidine kinase
VEDVHLARRLAHELEPALLSLFLRLRALPDEGAHRAEIESCLVEVQSLRLMVQEFLFLGKREMERRIFPLAPLLERLERRFRPIAAARGITLEIASSAARVEANSGASERSLSNLLDNALKFSDAGSHVALSTREVGETIEVIVADQGIGIPLVHQRRIFDPFERLSRERPGAGLGLAIARELVEAQGGRLTVTSEPGKGSTFVLALKRA